MVKSFALRNFLMIPREGEDKIRKHNFRNFCNKESTLETILTCKYHKQVFFANERYQNFIFLIYFVVKC